MVGKYIPRQKDIVFVDFNPIKGYEQAGYRPCIVISNNVFNKYTKMVIVCPITSNEKEFPTHHILKNTKKIRGSVLCEHIRSIDYEVRSLKFVEKCKDIEFEQIMGLMNACFDEE